MEFREIFSLGLYAELADVWQALFGCFGATGRLIFFGGASELQLGRFCLSEEDAAIKREEILEQLFCKPEVEDVSVVEADDPF